MSQASNAPSTAGKNSGLQNAPGDVEDTASSVGPHGAGALPGLTGYAEASATSIAPNTAFMMRRTQSPVETSMGMRRARSVSPVGFTIVQRQAQLATQIASSAASAVSHVAAATDAMHNVAEQALATATHTAGSIEGIVREHITRLQADNSKAVDDVAHRLAAELTAVASGSVERSESRIWSMVDTLREELRLKFSEDQADEERRRGQVETRLTVLSANVENLQKRMNELQIPDVNLLAKMEQNLQQQISEKTVDTSIGMEKLTERLEEQSHNNEVTLKVLDSLTKKIDQLSENLSTIQADFQRWKTLEVQYNAENMEEDMTDVGNTTVSVPMSVTPPTSTPSFVFGETAEIQPAQPTMSQTAPAYRRLFLLHSSSPATRANTETF